MQAILHDIPDITFPELPRAGGLLVLGGLRISEGTEPRHLAGGLRGGGDFRAGSSASIPHWPAGTCGAAVGAEYAEPTGPEPPSARLPILKEQRRIKGQKPTCRS